MLASLRSDLTDNNAALKPDRFLELLPRIRRQASRAFRHLRTEARHELTAETVANAFCAFVRLARQGKVDLAYATPLAQFGIRQACDGRRVGCRQNTRDVMSVRARRTHGIKIEPIDRWDGKTGAWNQLLVEDRKAGPAETAAARIDVAEWFSRLSKRNRTIAKTLALGEPTGAVARKFNLSSGRVSQLRNWFERDWKRFQTGNTLNRIVSVRSETQPAAAAEQAGLFAFILCAGKSLPRKKRLPIGKSG